MVKTRAPIEKLLIVNPGAGSVDDHVMERLREEFPDYEVVAFPPEDDFVRTLAKEGALVIACGGDGTIAAVARALAGTAHSFGILAMGTFNNFARSLGLPTDFEEAIQVIKTGRPTPCTIGRINGEEFLEAAAIGVFGETLALGETAKDLHFGDVRERLRSVARARRFRFRTDGDVTLAGEAVSLILANTPSIGALVPVGQTSPEEPHLELIVTRGRSRLALLATVARAVLRRRPPPDVESHQVRRLRIVTTPRMTVHADVTEAGRTPAEVETVAGGLRVILPVGKPAAG